jgi:hypothetical protein
VGLHAIQWRYFAEDLVRLRRADERRRYAAPQRAGKVDANPHQIEAVIFALSRLPEGGCILADEVGLGKTIEAGLVIAQLRAEGARRILLITPKPLLGQWRQELFNLFGVEARDGAGRQGLEGEGVFLLGREVAGSEAGSRALLEAEGFDLIVIDEAHEIFAGLHKRFTGEGEYRENAKQARMAGRVFQVLRLKDAPVLLLTATPIQNNLLELWALVRYVDPNGTLLGALPTFRKTFCDKDDRSLAEGQADELRRRIELVLKRTLRRQAQEFLAKPFVDRQARLFEYPMTEDERTLYEDVTRYLLRPNLAAFRGKQRRLLLIGFQRRMASSKAALADSLEKVAERLRRIVDGDIRTDAGVRAFVADLEDDDLAKVPSRDDDSDGEGEATAVEDEGGVLIDRIQAELALVESLVNRARALEDDGKAQALLKAVRLVLDRGHSGEGSGKLVIFTESIVTQNYLRELLIRDEIVRDEDVTLFRGDNETPRGKEALDRWFEEEGRHLAPYARPGRDIALRTALLHEFKTRSKIFISTEAGAKGLNLQFCETVVNYDLPWNPQRIEQRIGRCHRYGQTRDVTVINFLAKDNETDRLTFEILSQKLDLFGTVLDASDVVLHRPGQHSSEVLASALGAELEASLHRVWERARTIEEIHAELRELRDRMEEARKRFDDIHSRTKGLIESHLDQGVRRVFLERKEELPAALAELDADLERVATAYLTYLGASFRTEETPKERLIHIEAHPNLPDLLRAGLSVAVGASGDSSSLHLSHPLIVAAIAAAKQVTGDRTRVAVEIGRDSKDPLADWRGAQGRLVLFRIRHAALEPFEELLPVAWIEGEDTPLPRSLAERLLTLPMTDAEDDGSSVSIDDRAIEDAVEEAIFRSRNDVAERQGARFERNLAQIERYIEDRLFVLRREHADLERRIREAEARRAGVIGPEARTEADQLVKRLDQEREDVEVLITRLTERDDELYQRCRTRLHERSYSAPAVEKLVDVELRLL